MAGRFQLPLLDADQMAKMLGNYDQVSNDIFSPQELDQIQARYGSIEDQGTQDAYNSALMGLSQQFSPAYDAIRARNYGLYSGGQAGRDYSRVTGDVIGRLMSQKLGLGAQSAARKAANFRALAMQRIQGRQGLGQQMYGRILGAQKSPTNAAKIASGALQVGGAIAGSFGGGQSAPMPTQDMGSLNDVPSSLQGGLPAAGYQAPYDPYSTYRSGQSMYSGNTMMRRGGY